MTNIYLFKLIIIFRFILITIVSLSKLLFVLIDNDNIIALATPSGLGAISVIRVSGPESIQIVDKIFYSFDKISLKQTQSNKILLGYIKDSDSFIDKVLVSIFRNPKSYTGEDVVEISCHCSSFIQNSIIQLLLKLNCRLAKPGEFTMKAFLNGKMDLSEAESVADLISSNSESSHKIAMNQMRGGFRNDINMLRERLLNFASLIELELDFSQEDVEFANTSELKNILDDIEKKLVDLIASFKTGQVIKNGIPIVIIGEPNSGKSTLLNNLLNEDRAIVSSIPGTTRDTIEDQITLNGVVCRFIDTAGIRNTIDEIESIGIEKTFKKIEEAEIIIYLIDVLDLRDKKIEYHKKYIHEIEQKYNDKHIIQVINKIDIAENDFSKKMKALKISAKENLNINVLKESIINHIQEMTGNYESSIISNSRHYDILFKTKLEIEKVRSSIKNKVPSDLLAIDIKQALNLLGELTGEISNDEILGNIFSKFCIGK